MAREIVTNIWCDPCLQGWDGGDSEHTPGEELPAVKIGNKKPRILAMCERHRKTYHDPFATMLDELGQIAPDSIAPAAAAPAAPKKSRHGTYPCPDPACEKHENPYGSPSSLSNHARGRHGMTLNELRISLGQDPVIPYELSAAARRGDGAEDGDGETVDGETVNGETVDEEATELVCPVGDCGKVYAMPEYKQPKKARAVHMAKVHGIPGEKRNRGKAAAAV